MDSSSRIPTAAHLQALRRLEPVERDMPLPPSSTGKRSLEHADVLALNDMASPLPEQCKRRKRDESSQNVQKESNSTRRTKPRPSSSSSSTKDERVHQLPSEPPKARSNHVMNTAKSNIPSLSFERSLWDVQDHFTRAQNEIQDLKERLERQAHQHKQDKLHLKQGFILDLMKRSNDEKTTLIKHLRERASLARDLEELKDEAAKQKDAREAEKARLSKALADVELYKIEVDHLEASNKTMEEDLDELRRIENEDAAQRHSRSLDLPPAYGSLNDDDRYPKHPAHTDGGIFEISVMKNAMRTTLMKQIHFAQAKSDHRRTYSSPESAHDILFVVGTRCLSILCEQLSQNLYYAEKSFTTAVLRNQQQSASKGLDGLQIPPCKAFVKLRARREFVADRIAKLIIDLCGRLVSATLLRFELFRLTTKKKAELGLNYQNFDECLLKALRSAFHLGESRTSKASVLWELQHYYFQVDHLCDRLDRLRTGISYAFFKRSLDWLSEQVESERMHQANAQAELPHERSAGAAHTRDEFSLALNHEVSSDAASDSSDGSSSDGSA